MKKGVFNDVLYVASNELDWPHKSAGTGYTLDDLKDPVRSLYKELVKRNRCNRGDY
jgi:hypothetical protein